MSFVNLGVSGLKIVELTVPPYALEGSDVTLLCTWDLEGEQLYSLQWYKNSYEFYRYSPRQHPKVQTFPVPGVNVNVSREH